MVSCYMPLRHSVMPTGVLWLSKWQSIKAFPTGGELRQACDCFFSSSLLTWLDRQMQPS